VDVRDPPVDWRGAFLRFFGLFLRFWRANLWEHTDTVWLAKLLDVLGGHDENLPEVGKYNAGQKVVFWSMSLLILADFQRRRDLGSVLLVILDGRAEAHRRAGALDCRDRGDLCVDRACLCGDLGARYN
jgi:hypothetical protein